MTGPLEQGGIFPSTRWTLVERAGDGQLHVRRLALEELLRLYWPALQSHLRRRGRVVPDRIDDLLQGFVCDKIVEDGLLASCQRGSGKFRTFLLTTLDHYLIDQYRRQAADCRAPERALDGSKAGSGLNNTPAANGDPSEEFDAAWARQTLREGVRRTREECEDSGRLDVWCVLHDRLLGPILEGTAIVPYEQIAERLNLQSVARAANLLTTGKRAFQRKLREVVRQYCADEDEVEQEVRELRRILAGQSGCK